MTTNELAGLRRCTINVHSNMAEFVIEDDNGEYVAVSDLLPWLAARQGIPAEVVSRDIDKLPEFPDIQPGCDHKWSNYITRCNNCGGWANTDQKPQDSQPDAGQNIMLMAREKLIQAMEYGEDFDDAILMLNAATRINRLESEATDARQWQPVADGWVWSEPSLGWIEMRGDELTLGNGSRLVTLRLPDDKRFCQRVTAPQAQALDAPDGSTDEWWFDGVEDFQGDIREVRGKFRIETDSRGLVWAFGERANRTIFLVLQLRGKWWPVVAPWDSPQGGDDASTD